jgi:adenylosuccinate synthase
MQGCGAFLADKIMRRKSIKLARDYSQLDQLVTDKFDLVSKTSSSSHGLKEAAVKFSHLSMPRAIRAILQQGGTALHEGSQGFSLDINHGSHYPECTSRSTTAIQNIADMGIAHSLIGDIYLVIRPYPIRVGNVIENGQTIGYSGDCYSDHKEISWEEVAKEAGAPPEEMQKELTTVTKRLRRVFTFSKEQLIEAVEINGATKIALNFANYIDWACYGMNDYEALPQKVKNFILDIEDIARIPVTIVGTGPQLNHICYAE